MALYRDKTRCPKCRNEFVVYRRESSAGKVVATWCGWCRKAFRATAGQPSDS